MARRRKKKRREEKCERCAHDIGNRRNKYWDKARIFFIVNVIEIEKPGNERWEMSSKLQNNNSIRDSQKNSQDSKKLCVCFVFFLCHSSALHSTLLHSQSAAILSTEQRTRRYDCLYYTEILIKFYFVDKRAPAFHPTKHLTNEIIFQWMLSKRILRPKIALNAWKAAPRRTAARFVGNAGVPVVLLLFASLRSCLHFWCEKSHNFETLDWDLNDTW